jgi:peptidoglycan/xylan/chitin deacetylase (PgdA/CDA1 family)
MAVHPGEEGEMRTSATRRWVGGKLAGAFALLAMLTATWGTTQVPARADTSGHAVVTLGFDDGTQDQYDNAFPLLQAHTMVATFFVNTGPILAGDPTHTTFAELRTMFKAGNEITGHTVDHANIQPLSISDAEAEVCTDRNTLIDHGFQPDSFAYPFGSFDGVSEQVVRYCGYNSGRGVSGISKRSSGPFGETIPPLDRYSTRTPPNPKKATKLSTLELYVLNAENDSSQTTDWVQFVFHKVCDKSTGGHCGAYSISPSKFDAFLTFLEDEVTAGRVVVQTTAQVIDQGGIAYNPSKCEPTTGTGCIGSPSA